MKTYEFYYGTSYYSSTANSFAKMWRKWEKYSIGIDFFIFIISIHMKTRFPIKFALQWNTLHFAYLKFANHDDAPGPEQSTFPSSSKFRRHSAPRTHRGEGEIAGAGLRQPPALFNGSAPLLSGQRQLAQDTMSVWLWWLQTELDLKSMLCRARYHEQCALRRTSLVGRCEPQELYPKREPVLDASTPAGAG